MSPRFELYPAVVFREPVMPNSRRANQIRVIAQRSQGQFGFFRGDEPAALPH